MNYYVEVNIESNRIVGYSTCPVRGDTILCIPITEEIYQAVSEDMRTYIYDPQSEQIIINPNYEEEVIEERIEQFNKEFFSTSLGWIRRKPTLADGTEDDFLNNDLPLLAIGLMTGSNPVLPIAYQTPDFTQELTKEYMESLQVKNQPITQQFIAECSAVKMRDFTG